MKETREHLKPDSYYLQAAGRTWLTICISQFGNTGTYDSLWAALNAYFALSCAAGALMQHYTPMACNGGLPAALVPGYPCTYTNFVEAALWK